MFFETMGNVSKIGLRHSLMALLHGVVASAQARDGFTTRCRKERATRGEFFHGVVKGAQAGDKKYHGVER